MNNVTLIGNLTRDSELKYLNSGTAVLNFSIAVNKKQKDRDDEVLFMECTLFGKLGEKIYQYLTRGKKIAIIGRLKQDYWVDANGNKRNKIYTIVEQLEMLGGKSEGNQNNYNSAPHNKQQEPAAVDINEEDIPF